MPVFRSTARSAMMMRPFSGNVEPSARISSSSPRALHLALGPHALVHQVLALADAHVDAHRIDVGDGGQQRGVALSDEIAGRHLARAGDAVDRRRDGAVLDVQLGLANAGIRGLRPPPAPAGSTRSG